MPYICLFLIARSDNYIVHRSERVVIGWKAKFYETPLLQYKNELIETTIKNRKGYSVVTKEILYID